ncbi:MAG TPA: hypothetical protein VK486_00685 [Thermoleophilaceae bacterium]|nr:hypothetical protein [Thermoleophilaceae bacterium]
MSVWPDGKQAAAFFSFDDERNVQLPGLERVLLKASAAAAPLRSAVPRKRL